MTQKVPNNFPPLLVSVKTIDDVEKLNQSKTKVKMKVKWEAYKLSGQCFNCQHFGHTKSKKEDTQKNPWKKDIPDERRQPRRSEEFPSLSS